MQVRSSGFCWNPEHASCMAARESSTRDTSLNWNIDIWENKIYSEKLSRECFRSLLNNAPNVEISTSYVRNIIAARKEEKQSNEREEEGNIAAASRIWGYLCSWV